MLPRMFVSGHEAAVPSATRAARRRSGTRSPATGASSSAVWACCNLLKWRRMTDMGRKKLSQDILNWIEARKRFHLSHAHVQMARELGMNPKKLGKLDNHRQEPWKAPLPQFIEHLYFKRFGKVRPEFVMSVEERARAKEAKRAARKEARRHVRAQEAGRPVEAAARMNTGTDDRE